MSATFKTIEEFLYQRNSEFVVPNYQRGYKWAVKKADNQLSEVEKLIKDLEAAESAGKDSYFLQGVTVCKESIGEKERIVLIDGQQRTTTLYLILWCLNKEKIKDIMLSYDIREKSRKFIEELKELDSDFNFVETQDDGQDIYYFKEAIKQIREKIKELDKDKFETFLLKRVNILYITIDMEKAVKTFTMMNGAKAIMRKEELIKAEMLRQVSIADPVYTDEDRNSSEWEINALRSRYAREWDKWLYWWNKEDVKNFFRVDAHDWLLLDYYYDKKNIHNDKKFDYHSFHEFISNKKNTKEVFKELRDLQKNFEDIFNNAQIYNYLGVVLNVSVKDKKEKYKTIDYFIKNKNNRNDLEEFARNKVISAEEIDEVRDRLINSNDVYSDEKDKRYVYNYLLWLNVKEMEDKKFNFRDFEYKSLEHICPQNPSQDDKDFLRAHELIEKESKLHSIGNLVLLNGSTNSGLSNKKLNEKREYLFNQIKNGLLLPHTLKVFSRAFSNQNQGLFDNKNYWTLEDINANAAYFKSQFEKDYGIKINVPKDNNNE